MDGTLLERQSKAVLEGYARELRVDSGWWDTGGITFAERDPAYVWPYEALVLTTPGGSVVSVAPGLIEHAREHQPSKHYEVTQPAFLNAMADAGRAAGRSPQAYGPSICWALGTAPEAPTLPAGLRFETWELDRMKAEMAVRRFENGLGEIGSNGREFRNKWAIAAVDASGEPLAVAGVFATSGLDEIGVDVVRAERGRGLGLAVVAAATREILERGGTPFYGCAAANIRSQRTARAAGFVPVFADASVA